MGVALRYLDDALFVAGAGLLVAAAALAWGLAAGLAVAGAFCIAGAVLVGLSKRGEA